MMKNLMLLSLIFISTQILSQQIDNKKCDDYLKQTGLKYLKCTYQFEKIDSGDKIYQFYKWSAFGKTIFTNVEKRKTGYFLVSHELNQPIYNEKTYEFDYPITICQDRKLTEKEFHDFESVLNENKFWEKETYDLEQICSDGFGIVFQALHDDDYRNYSNGNCAAVTEYLKCSLQ